MKQVKGSAALAKPAVKMCRWSKCINNAEEIDKSSIEDSNLIVMTLKSSKTANVASKISM